MLRLSEQPATSEVIATVPERFTAVSNGALVGTTANGAAKTRTFHWRHDVPHSVYLMTLAAGEFALIEERAGNTPVTYYVAPGREDDARRAFGNTPKMIQFFERVIGVPYPYAKYAQVAVSDFIFGGMENRRRRRRPTARCTTRARISISRAIRWSRTSWLINGGAIC